MTSSNYQPSSVFIGTMADWASRVILSGTDPSGKGW